MADDDPNRAELLSLWLDGLENALRSELKDPRIIRHAHRLSDVVNGRVYSPRILNSVHRYMDLAKTLEALSSAREELAQRPARAELTLRVLRVVMNRWRPAAALADRHYEAAMRGHRAGLKQARPTTLSAIRCDTEIVASRITEEI